MNNNVFDTYTKFNWQDAANSLWNAYSQLNLAGFTKDKPWGGIVQTVGNMLPAVFNRFNILQNKDPFSKWIDSRFKRQTFNDSIYKQARDIINYKTAEAQKSYSTANYNNTDTGLGNVAYNENTGNYGNIVPDNPRSPAEMIQRGLATPNTNKTTTIKSPNEVPEMPQTVKQPTTLGTISTFGAGQVAGWAANKGVTALGNSVFGKSTAGQIATGVTSQVASTAASAAASGATNAAVTGANVGKGVTSGLSSAFSSTSGLSSLGLGAANLALDLGHKIKKSGWEQGVSGALGIASMIPGLGLVPALVNTTFNIGGHVGASKTQRFKANHDLLSNLGASYGGTVRDILNAEQLANTSYSNYNISGRHSDDAKITQARKQYDTLQSTYNYNQFKNDLNTYTSDIQAEKYKQDMDGLYSKDFYTKVAKEGGTLDNISLLKEIPIKETFLLKEIPIKFSEQIFKQGGSINVIPDGALHARLHHMDNDSITKKGIPVVSNNGDQQAEIEKEEIILRLEVTKKLEELSKIYYDSKSSTKEKDNAALDAGELLTHEILYNTQDNTNKFINNE